MIDRKRVERLKIRLQNRIDIVTHAIELIRLIAARGNTQMEGTISLADELKSEIDDFHDYIEDRSKTVMEADFFSDADDAKSIFNSPYWQDWKEVLPTGLKSLLDETEKEQYPDAGASFAIGELVKRKGFESKHNVVIFPGTTSTGIESWGIDSVDGCPGKSYFRKRLWGSIFIFITLESFNSVVLVTVTVTRKMLSMCLSVLLYGHTLEINQWIGLALVFSGISLETAFKLKKVAKKT